MAQQSFSFFKPSGELAEKLTLDPLPFPVRSERAESMFGADAKGPLADRLLDELDEFLHTHPEHREAYASNAGRLAMICATHHASNGDFAAALEALNAGLRVDPQNKALKVHQALALQLHGYDELAARIYEQLLWEIPHAYDPLVCALAAKSFAACGDSDKALEILSTLPEQMFTDPALAKLRTALANERDGNQGGDQTTSATAKQLGSPAIQGKPGAIPSATAERKFCTQCGTKLRPGAKFCTVCGALTMRT